MEKNNRIRKRRIDYYTHNGELRLRRENAIIKLCIVLLHRANILICHFKKIQNYAGKNCQIISFKVFAGEIVLENGYH